MKTHDDDLDLDKIKGTIAAATPGPWRVSMSGYSVKSHDTETSIVATVTGGPAARPIDIKRWLPNADFMVLARAQFPAAIAEIERLRAELESLREIAVKADAWEATYQREGEESYLASTARIELAEAVRARRTKGG